MATFDAQIIQSLTFYALDSAGRIPASGSCVLRGCETAIKTVGFTASMDAGVATSERTVNGKSCTPPPAVPIDNGYDVAVTWCGQNPVFESITGFAELFMASSVVEGYAAKEYTPGLSLAMELVLSPYGDESKTLGLFFPKLGGWSKSGGQAFDGASRADASFTGRTAKSAKVFDLHTTGDALPSELDHWLPRRAPIVAGNVWYVGHKFATPPTLETGVPTVLDALVP